jgi:hypothetical protein
VTSCAPTPCLLTISRLDDRRPKFIKPVSGVSFLKFLSCEVASPTSLHAARVVNSGAAYAGLQAYECGSLTPPIDVKDPALYGAAFSLQPPHGPRSSLFSFVRRHRRGAGAGMLHTQRHLPRPPRLPTTEAARTINDRSPHADGRGVDQSRRCSLAPEVPLAAAATALHDRRGFARTRDGVHPACAIGLGGWSPVSRAAMSAKSRGHYLPPDRDIPAPLGAGAFDDGMGKAFSK